MGPRDGGVVGEGAEEPERSERAFVAGGEGMRRSEEAKVPEDGGLINQTLIGLKTYERLCTY